MARIRALLLLWLVTYMPENVQLTRTICISPQYMELGTTGTINCSFDNFYAVLWYNASDFEKGIPTLQYEEYRKTGPGYESGEFDVNRNGTLVIKEVTMRHDAVFTVAHTRSEKDFYIFYNVRVTVFVKPSTPFPTINKCGKENNKCFIETNNTTLWCLVRIVRPSIPLELFTRTADGDRNISNDLTIISEDSGYTSNVTTNNVFRHSSRLTLVVCKASGLPWLFQDYESTILMLNEDLDYTKEKSRNINVKQQTRLELNCTISKVGFVVWKRASLHDNMERRLLLYSIFLEDKYWEIVADDVKLENNTTLVIQSIDVKQEGMYFCIYGNGLTDMMIVYNVTVTVPAYPLIKGCNRHQYCVLEVERVGTLTCTVKGIRPAVQLRWRTSSDDSSLNIFKDELTVKDKGKTFDVILVSQYRVRDEALDKLTVKCEVLGRERHLLGLDMKVDLHFVKGKEVATSSPLIASMWVILTVAVACLLFVILGLVIKRCIDKRKSFNKGKDNSEEITSILEERPATVQKYTSEMKQQFLKQLRTKYRDFCGAIQPLPYIKERMFCVNTVFVEGGIEYCDSSMGREGHWMILDTYRNIFDGTTVHSTRYILEGEPGYGKSTIALQIAYDWCNSIESSPLKDVDLLIFLRLRQLGGVASIYRAIKQFILPKDSQLSEPDIQNILTNSNSVVIILDGFDEYPDQDSRTSDVNNIIARHMFQEFQVLLTTRISPKKYPPSTKRLRLTGFDERARRYYIRKAVVGNDGGETSVFKVERYIAENPILSDLCQVPLLFVMFAHVTYESEEFREFNSVTTFFRYMISCFHSHMRNKMEDDNVRKCELFETEHYELDKVAFDALNEQKGRLVWDKNKMCQLVGQEFYEQYVRIGILVEEECFSIIDDPRAPITEHVQYKTEVRFYHKLFCEWYAAHYLSKYTEKNPNLNLNEYLKYLRIDDVHYLFRFACGLSYDASKKIMEYLPTTEGGDKLAILCILEKTGKIDSIENQIRQLCSEGIIISDLDSLLLQRCSIQLLEIASRREIPVDLVDVDCLESVDPYAAAIKIKSGLILSSEIPLNTLVITLHSRRLTEKEAIDILRFSSKCESLTSLRFDCCLSTRSFEITSTLSTLQSRNVTVKYRGDFAKCPNFILNLRTGKWELESNHLECTEDDFERMNTKWREWFGHTDETYLKERLKINRNVLRQRRIPPLAPT